MRIGGSLGGKVLGPSAWAPDGDDGCAKQTLSLSLRDGVKEMMGWLTSGRRQGCVCKLCSYAPSFRCKLEVMPVSSVHLQHSCY